MKIRIFPNSSSTFGFLIQLLFQLVFVGAGCVALGFAYVEYRQGGDMQQVYVFGGVGAAFVLFSGFGIYRAWRGRRRAQHATLHERQYADAPWRVRPEWRSAELAETRPSGSEKYFAILWNAVAWPIAGFFLYTELANPDPDWAVLLVLLFPLVGLVLAWQRLRHALHRRKFGVTALVMEEMPGRLGEPLRMRLKTGVRPDDAPEEGFHVRLSCYRRSIRYTTDSDGDRQRRVEKDLLWRDEKRVRGRTGGSGDRLEVLARFELPADPPPSTPEKHENRIMWELDAEADLPGLDFQTSFEIPVFDSERGDRERKPEPTTGTAAPDQSAPPVPGGARDAGEALPEETDAYADYEVGATFTEPESEGITMERSPRGGLQLHFAAGRNKVMGALLAIFAVLLGLGGLLVLAESFFVALIFLLFAGFCGYGAWKMLTTASTLTVEAGKVTLVRGAFGRGTPVTFACEDLADVSIKANGQVGSKTHYDLVLHRHDMEARQQAAAGEDAIDQIADFTERTGLVRGSDAEHATDQIKQSIQEQSTQLTVARGLINKQEADWIAATIREATRREASFS